MLMISAIFSFGLAFCRYGKLAHIKSVPIHFFSYYPYSCLDLHVKAEKIHHMLGSQTVFIQGHSGAAVLRAREKKN
jgi:hypothetical protein